MGLTERYHDNAAKEVAKRVGGEQVLLVAFANRPGSMSAALTSQVLAADAASGGPRIGANAPQAVIHREGGKDTRLPLNFVVAVTPTKVYVYRHKMFWGRVKIKDELGVFDRAGLRVATGDGSMTKQFLLESPSQRQTMAFEMVQKDALGRLTRNARTDEMESLLRQSVAG